MLFPLLKLARPKQWAKNVFVLVGPLYALTDHKHTLGGVLPPALITAAILAVLPFLLPNSFYFDIVNRMAINAVLALGLNLLIGFAGQISLGHAAFFGIGAYASARLCACHQSVRHPSTARQRSASQRVDGKLTVAS